MKNCITEKTELVGLLQNNQRTFSVALKTGKKVVCKGVAGIGFMECKLIPFYKDEQPFEICFNDIESLKVGGVVYQNKVHIPEAIRNVNLSKNDMMSKPAIHIGEIHIAKGRMAGCKDGFQGRIVRYYSNSQITLLNERTGEQRIVTKNDLVTTYALKFWDK